MRPVWAALPILAGSMWTWLGCADQPEPDLSVHFAPLFVQRSPEQLGLAQATAPEAVDVTDHVEAFSGGLAFGDWDDDGLPDLAWSAALGVGLKIFHNEGEGQFREIVDVDVASGSPDAFVPNGVALVDLTGDGRADLFAGALDGVPRLFPQADAGSLGDVQFPLQGYQVGRSRNTWGSSFGDVDGDGLVDVYLAHWDLGGWSESPQSLWINTGSGFVDASLDAGLDILVPRQDLSFTPILVDANGDGRQDVLVAADFGQSRVLLQEAGGGFVRSSIGRITDENGMGAALLDAQGDGSIHWFVSSIFDDSGAARSWGATGNRLYVARGTGDTFRFEDVSEQAGVRDGGWGWGACAEDFDNDGDTDIFLANGSSVVDAEDAMPFSDQRSRLYLNTGEGVFREMGNERNVRDRWVTTAILCADYDRDGDVDVILQTDIKDLVVYENVFGAAGSYLRVRLQGPGGNPLGLGSKIVVRTGSTTQTAWMVSGTGFMSQGPYERHFGLGDATRVDAVEVQWPDGSVSIVRNVQANIELQVAHPVNE